MTVIVCHPNKEQWAQGYAAGIQQDEDDVIEVVTREDCPPGKIYMGEQFLKGELHE